MRIDILCKPDCGGRCYTTLSNVRQALDQMRLDAEVHLYQDPRKLIDNRVYVTPALILDDVVRISGRVPEVVEIKALVAERARFIRRLRDAV
ncbi:redox-active disulfide protein 2 [Syntrophotalea carbinolica DSM 2380]|uniref:Redox-active disulfide protein 2 n=1 Tax=Syntrophotalea carbinolica (strain DSM 2380 / NBRC 103641 / GraBd1) TaxID=338963 RepID=Q3A0D6_SYNC1|nr:thioredoxin family protein [Syntrophotalea carbinolica]ABA90171.1 redox-active disulfide protein 2 [Syntrophotalea carbinolica DSM 2380]